MSREQDIAAKARPVVAYLTQYEHVDSTTARPAGWVIGELRVCRFFFWSWWLEPLTTCLTHAADALTRLTVHIGVRISDAYLPHCPACRNPLCLNDIRIPHPTGRCRTCPPPPAHLWREPS
jgi:hypothetical protein